MYKLKAIAQKRTKNIIETEDPERLLVELEKQFKLNSKLEERIRRLINKDGEVSVE